MVVVVVNIEASCEDYLAEEQIEACGGEDAVLGLVLIEGAKRSFFVVHS